MRLIKSDGAIVDGIPHDHGRAHYAGVLVSFFERSRQKHRTQPFALNLLVRLNRLTQAHPVEVISEKGSPAHGELVGILHQLAERRA